jgi:hypothetical protein
MPATAAVEAMPAEPMSVESAAESAAIKAVKPAIKERIIGIAIEAIIIRVVAVSVVIAVVGPVIRAGRIIAVVIGAVVTRGGTARRQQQGRDHQYTEVFHGRCSLHITRRRLSRRCPGAAMNPVIKFVHLTTR